jgi:2-methylisocitrate lyase-like PEP mutase family enzyme
LRSGEQMDSACRRFAARVPLLANMVEGGQTPMQSATELQSRGFRIAIFPGGTARAIAHTLQGYFASMRAHRTTAPWQTQMLDFDGLNAIIGTRSCWHWGGATPERTRRCHFFAGTLTAHASRAA